MLSDDIDGLTDYEVLRRIQLDEGYILQDQQSGGLLFEIHEPKHSDSIGIERMVLEAIATSNRKLSEEDRRRLRRRWVRAHRNLVSNYVAGAALCDPTYNHLTEIFFEGVLNVSKLERAANQVNTISRKPLTRDVLCEEVLDEVIKLSKDAKFLRTHNQLKQRSRGNQKSGESYIDDLFGQYSKLLVCRMDLYMTSEYLKQCDIEESRKYESKHRKELDEMQVECTARHIANGVSLSLAQSYANATRRSNVDVFVQSKLREMARQKYRHLMNNRRGCMLFDNVVGYIAKMEYGQSRGHHFHVILFMDGQKVKSDQFIVQEVGKYWRDVVMKGRGAFHNCNQKIFGSGMYAYKRVGIGMINHTDFEKRNVLKKDVLGYMTKREQLVRADVSGKKFRVFSRGSLRDDGRERKLGRPRKNILSKEIKHA